MKAVARRHAPIGAGLNNVASIPVIMPKNSRRCFFFTKNLCLCFQGTGSCFLYLR